MKFTPGQAREALQLSQAAFRHWKETLPPLAGRNGYSPCFTLGDLLAMAVIRTLTEDVGVPVGKLYPLAAELFDQCSRTSWVGLERSTLIIDTVGGRVQSFVEIPPGAPDFLAIIMPLRPIISGLQMRLLLEQPAPSQKTLQFPPTALPSARQGQR